MQENRRARNHPALSPAGVDFVQGKQTRHETYRGPAQAALAAALANLEIRGEVRLPRAEAPCHEWRKAITERLATARNRFDELAASRAGNDSLREQVVNLLVNWFIHGRPVERRAQRKAEAQDDAL